MIRLSTVLALSRTVGAGPAIRDLLMLLSASVDEIRGHAAHWQQQAQQLPEQLDAMRVAPP